MSKSYDPEASYRRAISRLLGTVNELLDFIQKEHSLCVMEAHHDGHPISKEARKVWDRAWEAISEVEETL